MQTQHLIIIAACSALGLLLMAHFTRCAILRAMSRSYIAGHTNGINLKNKQLADQIESLTSDMRRVATTHERAIEQAQTQYTLLVKHLTPQLEELRATANGLTELCRPNQLPHAKKQAILTVHTQELDRTCRALFRCLHPNDTDKAAA